MTVSARFMCQAEDGQPKINSVALISNIVQLNFTACGTCGLMKSSSNLNQSEVPILRACRMKSRRDNLPKNSPFGD